MISISNVCSIHTRKRVLKRRFGISKGELSVGIHVGKRSVYFYPKTSSRAIKPQNVFI